MGKLNLFKFGKFEIALAFVFVGTIINAVFFTQWLSIRQVLTEISVNDKYILEQRIKGKIKHGRIGSFLECLNNFEDISRRKGNDQYSRKYENGEYYLIINQYTFYLSVSGGTAHSMFVKLTNDRAVTTNIFAIQCNLDKLGN